MIVGRSPVLRLRANGEAFERGERPSNVTEHLMANRSIWLEVALNGPWARALQPRIPITVDELVADGIACARAGAAIVHVHAYDERTGRQRDDAETYRRIIGGIREQEDVIVYPTLPVMGGPDAPRGMTAPERFKAVEQLAMQGLLEWSVVDPGSLNVAHHHRIAAREEGFRLSQSRRPRTLRPRARRALRLPSQLRDLRARFPAARRRARPRPRRADADLPLHVLRRLCVRLSAPGVRARGLPEAAGGPGARRALDGRRARASAT